MPRSDASSPAAPARGSRGSRAGRGPAGADRAPHRAARGPAPAARHSPEAAPAPAAPRGPAAPPRPEYPDFPAYAAARWPRLLRTAYLLTGDHHEAEDLVQTALAKIYPVWSRIRTLDEPDAYVHRVLVNTNLNRFRKRRVVQLLTARLPERAREAATRQVEDRSALLTALAALPPRQRAVVVLRYWEDLSEQQVADALGCSPGNVKSQASRGLRKLREHPALAGPAAGGSRP